MQLERTATLVLHLWHLADIGYSPADVALAIRPMHLPHRHKWIPQTLGDCAWWWLEFETVEAKNTFLRGIPPKLKEVPGFIATHFTQADLDYWSEAKIW